MVGTLEKILKTGSAAVFLEFLKEHHLAVMKICQTGEKVKLRNRFCSFTTAKLCPAEI